MKRFARFGILITLLFAALMIIQPVPAAAQTPTLRTVELSGAQLFSGVIPAAEPCGYVWVAGTGWRFQHCQMQTGSDVFGYTYIAFDYIFPTNLKNIRVMHVKFTGACAEYPDLDSWLTIGGITITCYQNAIATGHAWDDLNMTAPDGRIHGRAKLNAAIPGFCCYVDHQDLINVEIYYYADDLPPAVIIPSPGADGTCKMCTYTPSGDWIMDAPKLLNYLACQIANIYYCTVIPILLGMWKTILSIVILIQSAFLYFSSSAGQVARWSNANVLTVLRYAEGTYFNGVRSITEAIYYAGGNTTIIQGSGGGNANLWDALVSLFNVFRGFIDAIPSIFNSLRDVIVSVVNAIMQLIFIIVGLIILIINIILALIGVALSYGGLVVNLFTAFLAGFTSAATNPFSAAMLGPEGPFGTKTILFNSCNTDPYFYVCLGAYGLDNTIFNAKYGASGVGLFMVLYLAAIGVVSIRQIFAVIGKLSKMLRG